MSRSEAHDQRNAQFREAFKTPFDFAATAKPTADLIPHQAKELELAHTVDDIPNGHGARLHWLGNTKPDKVILYFHGGGYAIPAIEGHVKLWKQNVSELEKQGKGLAVAMVEYTLTTKDGSGARYPVQVKQAIEALRFLLDKGNKASTIIIGGDSAGGQLALAVASAILHGFHGVEPIKLEGKLEGFLLVSPWVTYKTDSQSWKDNADKDVVSVATINTLKGAYVDDEDRNEYSEPHRAESSWWKNIPARSILSIYGGAECLRDDIRDVNKKLEDAGNAVVNIECAKQVHIDCVLDAQAGMEPGEMSREILGWLSLLW